MKTYAVNYNTPFAKRNYIVGAETESEAILLCQRACGWYNRDGKFVLEDKIAFIAQLIEGVTTRKAGIKTQLEF